MSIQFLKLMKICPKICCIVRMTLCIELIVWMLIVMQQFLVRLISYFLISKCWGPLQLYLVLKKLCTSEVQILWFDAIFKLNKVLQVFNKKMHFFILTKSYFISRFMKKNMYIQCLAAPTTYNFSKDVCKQTIFKLFL